MASFKKVLGGAALIAALPPLIAVKRYLYHRWQANRQRRAALRHSNRRQFGKLPRVKQQGVLAYRRSQLRDLENIYRKGYSPYATRRRRYF
jgi:hypothetical protein